MYQDCAITGVIVNMSWTPYNAWLRCICCFVGCMTEDIDDDMVFPLFCNNFLSCRIIHTSLVMSYGTQQEAIGRMSVLCS